MVNSYRQVTTSVTLLLVILMAGCASSPFYKDVRDRADYKDAEMTDDESLRVGFFARYLTDENTRAEIESEITKTRFVRHWEPTDYATTTAMASDAVAGELASDLGAGLGAAVLVFGLMSDDGSMDYVSQAFLPAEVDGKMIETAKEAKIATNALIRKRLEDVANKLDTELGCVQGCEDRSDSIFTMQLPAQKPNESFVYWPSDIVVTVDVGGATDVAPSNAISSLVGFPVAWKTLPGNSAEIRLYSEGSYDEKGELEFEPNPGNRKINPMVKRSIEGTLLGRSILKSIYSDKHLVWGSSEIFPGMVFLDGEVYGFASHGRVNFIRYDVNISPIGQLVD